MAHTAHQNTMQNQPTRRRALAKGCKTSRVNAAKIVPFADVMKAKAKSGNAVRVLAKNSVTGNEVVKNAIIDSNKDKGRPAAALEASAPAALQGSEAAFASQLAQASFKLQKLNQEFSLQYFNLQQSVQADSRQFTALSNVSEARSNTEKNSLFNIK